MFDKINDLVGKNQISDSDGQEIKSMTELNNIKNTHNIGDTMTVTVNRNGQEKEITLTLQEQ